MKVFGPVPSRRLGRSIGVNNIPHKTCSLSCVYCQIGRTNEMTVERREFYSAEMLFNELKEKMIVLTTNNSDVDYVTFVSDGEPTLDINLGKSIDLFKKLDVKVAVITNSTLIKFKEVRDDLARADWVSVKIDAVNEQIWKKIDRPHRGIRLKEQLESIKKFASEYKGKLVTETMLVKDLNDSVNNFYEIAEFISSIKPNTAYLGIPTRPPAESWVVAPDEKAINTAFQIFTSKKIKTEYLIGYEGNEFTLTGLPSDDILSITAVHPMREDAIRQFIENSGYDFNIIEVLEKKQLLKRVKFQNHNFYTRKIK